MSSSRRLTLPLSVAAKVLAACSLVTDFDGMLGGSGTQPDLSEGTEPRFDGGASDAAAAADRAAPPQDGADITTGLLSYDSFESGNACAPWQPSAATVESVTTAYAGALACKVCLTTTGVSGGISRTFPGTTAGSYHVRGRAQRIDAQDWRITMKFDVDGGVEPFYGLRGFVGEGWESIEMDQVVPTGYTNLDVSIWFGTAFQAGHCILVDDVTVSRDP